MRPSLSVMLRFYRINAKWSWRKTREVPHVGLQINQRDFNIELSWVPRLNQFNQLRGR